MSRSTPAAALGALLRAAGAAAAARRPRTSHPACDDDTDCGAPERITTTGAVPVPTRG